MNLNFVKSSWYQDSDGVWLSLKVERPEQAKEFVAGMKDKLYTAELKEYRKKRSLDANAYLWVLCQKIAEAVRNIAKDLDIETATPDEIALMKSRWEDAQADKGA